MDTVDKMDGGAADPRRDTNADGKETHTSDASSWDWEHDPENPYNWKTGKKWAQVGMICSYAMLAWVPDMPGVVLVRTSCLTAQNSSLGTSILAPAVAQLQEEFGVTVTQSILPISMYTFALGLGPVLGGPLSETSGRYVTFLGLGTLGSLFTLGVGFVHSFAGLCILRFLAGFCFGPSLAVSAGLLNDIFRPVDRGLPSVLFILTPFLGPGIA